MGQSSSKKSAKLQFTAHLVGGAHHVVTFDIPNASPQSIADGRAFLASVRDGRVNVGSISISLIPQAGSTFADMNALLNFDASRIRSATAQLEGNVAHAKVIRTIPVSVSSVDNYNLSMAIETVFSSYGIHIKVESDKRGSSEKMKDMSHLTENALLRKI